MDEIVELSDFRKVVNNFGFGEIFSLVDPNLGWKLQMSLFDDAENLLTLNDKNFNKSFGKSERGGRDYQ